MAKESDNAFTYVFRDRQGVLSLRSKRFRGVFSARNFGCAGNVILRDMSLLNRSIEIPPPPHQSPGAEVGDRRVFHQIRRHVLPKGVLSVDISQKQRLTSCDIFRHLKKTTLCLSLKERR